ncbi:unnamed protein product, partial [Trichobilharzia regenti]
NCGYIFCGNCSDRRIAVPSQPGEPVRVCRHCFFQLSRRSVKTSKQQLTEDYTSSVSSQLVKDTMRSNSGGGLVKNLTNPDFLHYMNGSVNPITATTGCAPNSSSSSYSNGMLRMTSSSGVAHIVSGSSKPIIFTTTATSILTTTTTATPTPTHTVNNHRLDAVITNNPPSRCHSAGGTRPTSSATSDGIAQA